MRGGTEARHWTSEFVDLSEVDPALVRELPDSVVGAALRRLYADAGAGEGTFYSGFMAVVPWDDGWDDDV
ncbi:FxSxx-COOH cyclophane-containing RiPP peptide [Acrocarpospora catenulata]|uniref:FxSxx-COOH cyclophane-containing RiPP peptide n=1 Tax=Acrocarpospora catenulata TaxID=2836182 RepID=UPI001BDA6DD5|nr:FxSxx-COOH cyclophane-containing RiPP peptide [Acrocarpospora catenulata]